MTTVIELTYQDLKSSQRLITQLLVEKDNKKAELSKLISTEFKAEQDYLKSNILQAYPDAKLEPIEFGFVVKSKHFGGYASNIKKSIDAFASDRICNVQDTDWYADGFRIKEVSITLTKKYMRTVNKDLVKMIESVSIV